MSPRSIRSTAQRVLAMLALLLATAGPGIAAPARDGPPERDLCAPR
jgi:hypothetical protein